MKPIVEPQHWVVSFFQALARQSIGHPRLVLMIAVLVTLAALPGLFRLKLRTDGHALVDADAPEVIYDRQIRGKFGVEDQLVVLIRSEDTNGIFNPTTLQLVRDLTAACQKLPAINPSNVVSLATEPSLRWRPGTLIRQTLLEMPPATPAESEQLREELRRIKLYDGTLVSADGRATVILLGVPSGTDRVELYERVQRILAARQPGPDDLAVTGAPVAGALLGIHILEDLGVPVGLLGTSTRAHTERLGGTMPANFYELRLLVARRIGFVPVALLVMALVFLVTFRNLLATLLPLLEVAAALVFVFGLMGWMGVPIYLTTAVMPVLLTTMCVTDEIHLFARYLALLRESPKVNHVELLRRGMNELASPVVSTTLTTAIGFVSFAFSPLRPVQAFGVFTALGVLFGLFYSLTVIPAMLTLIPPQWLVSRRQNAAPAGAGWLAACFARLTLAVVRRQYWAAGVIIAIAALTPLGLRQLVTQDSWIDGFAPESEFRRATERVNEQFHGMHLLLVSLEQPQTLRGQIPASAIQRGGLHFPREWVKHPTLIAGSPITITVTNGADDSRDLVVKSHIEMVYGLATNVGARIPAWGTPTNLFPAIARAGRADFEVVLHAQLQSETVRALADLARFIRERRQYAVGGVLGPCDYLETTRFMVYPNDPAARVLPDDPGAIKMLWDYYGIARGPARLRQIVDTNYWQSLTTVFLKHANFVDTAKLLADLREYERERLAPQGIRLGFAGDVAVSQSLIQGIVTTQVQSLVWSLLGIYAVTAVLGRSLRWGLYCVLPSALAVAINFAVLGWFGIPLGVATSMFAGMTLGIGVDFAIHLLEGWRREQEAGATPSEARARASAVTGPPVLINTIAISLGFGVLMLSQVPANARLGLLTVLGLVDCLIASLLLLPVLLHRWPPENHPRKLAEGAEKPA